MLLRPLALLLALAASPTLAQEACGKLTDCTPRTALLSAFGAEADHYLEAIEGGEVHVVNGIRFTTGRIEGHDVVLALTNVSMPNAVMVTQLLLDHFEVGRVVMSGIAGGVSPNLQIGDVVIPKRWALYQEMVFARETDDGTFEVPPFLQEDLLPSGADGERPHFDMMYPGTITLSTNADPQFKAGAEGVQSDRRLWFPVDQTLFEAARNLDIALTDCLQAPGSGAETCVSDDGGRKPRLVVDGNGVSGSTFVDNADFRAWVYDTFTDGTDRTNVLDMESAGAAFVAAANDVPFIAVRTVSDLAGGDVSVNVMPVFGGLAIANTSGVVLALLKGM